MANNIISKLSPDYRDLEDFNILATGGASLHTQGTNCCTEAKMRDLQHSKTIWNLSPDALPRLALALRETF